MSELSSGLSYVPVDVLEAQFLKQISSPTHACEMGVNEVNALIFIWRAVFRISWANARWLIAARKYTFVLPQRN